MNHTTVHRTAYQSYLLRFWRDGEHLPWHASAQCTRTEYIHHFANVEALFAFLLAEMDVHTPEGTTASHGGDDE